MKLRLKIVIAIVALAVGVVPAAALAHPGHGHSHGAPRHHKNSSSNPSPRSQAEKQCREERAKDDTDTFNKMYGTNRNDKDAFGRCVSHRTRQNQAAQASAHKSAEQTCRSEQGDSSFSSSHNGETFDQFYGTDKNGHNAFGKCVSSHERSSSEQTESSEVQAEENAGQQCRSEQSADPGAFRTKYGTNHNGHNAFGKCVSQKAHQQEQSGSGSGGGSGSSSS